MSMHAEGNLLLAAAAHRIETAAPAHKLPVVGLSCTTCGGWSGAGAEASSEELLPVSEPRFRMLWSTRTAESQRDGRRFMAEAESGAAVERDPSVNSPSDEHDSCDATRRMCLRPSGRRLTAMPLAV